MSLLDRSSSSSLPLVVIIAISLGASPVADATKKKKAKPNKALVLRVTVPRVGTVVTKDENLNMTINMKVSGKPFLISQTGHKKYTTEALEVSAEAVTKERITFLAVTEISFQNGQKKDGSTKVAGKSYIAERKDGDVVITNEDGSTPSAAEIEEVLDETRNVGKADSFGKLLAGKKFTLNAKVAISNDDFKALLGDSHKALGATGGSLTLVELRGAKAVMAMEITMAMNDGQMKIEMPMKGTVVIDTKTGWPAELSLEGLIQGAFEGEPLDGQMKMSMTYSYGY